MNEPYVLRKEIGKVLKSWFEAHDIPQAQVAKDLECSQAYVSALCGGKTIGKKMANKLAELYGISEAYLLTGHGVIDGDTPSPDSQNVFQHAIQKSNRIVQSLGRLVDDGEIENMLSAAPVLGIPVATLTKAMKYDPEGETDFIMVKLHEKYGFSLTWFLTGEGDMFEKEANQEINIIDSIKAENERLQIELQRMQEVNNRKFDEIMRQLSTIGSSNGLMVAEDLSTK